MLVVLASEGLLKIYSLRSLFSCKTTPDGVVQASLLNARELNIDLGGLLSQLTPD